MNRFLRNTLIGCTLLLLAWLFKVTVVDQQNSIAPPGFKTPNPIVGIWKGQHGLIMDLRSDGTARSRSTDSQNIQYFRYRLNADGFFVDYAAKPDEYVRRLRQSLLGMTSDRYDVVKMNDSELQLINSSSGETIIFARSEDSALAATP